MNITNRLLAEGIGTFAMVFFGCGAIVVNDLFGNPLGHLGVSAAFGLVVMAMIYSFGNISGAHINPAVTIGFAAAGRLDRRDVLPYVGSQVIGAVAAALCLRFLFPEHADLGSTSPQIAVGSAFAMESLLSFVLMLVVLNVSTGHMEKGIMAGVAIGGTIALEALVGGPVTGASMNPARSLGPAVVSLQLESLWLYLAAPIVGTVLAAPLCRWIQGDECCSPSFSTDKANA